MNPTTLTFPSTTEAPAIAESRERERLRTVIVPDAEDLDHLIARRIVDVIRRETSAKGYCVLGLATGSTPIGVYQELIGLHRAGEVDFASVITFNLDEYYPMSPSSIHSYRRFMNENLFDHIDIAPDNTHVPNGSIPRAELDEYCAQYEKAIREVGGIDFQILGIGRSGHIGFNEPGSPATSRTRLIALDTITRKDAAAEFFGEANVPGQAITMGIATILEAKEIALLATGEHKAPIVQRAVEGDVSHEVTATYLQQHPNATTYLDLAAAGDLTRIQTPWVLESVDWTPLMTDRAVVWASQRTGKAILKLTASDFRDNHLSSLLSQHATAGEINGAVFNRLRDKICGRARLPSRKRTLVFSPHPDDDVICMGGMLRKLRDNDNSIVIAYMTSGNIAVHDHDVLRHLDFVARSAASLGLDATMVEWMRREVEDELAHKQPGDVDTERVQYLKRFIRESEAVAAVESLGLPRTSTKFLNMPFYRTGEVRKRPIGDDDVALLRDLLLEVRPQLMFVAGDLSDPHGTHRMCLQAIERALSAYEGPRPETWLYRGAWEEWAIEDADMLVPLSQDEVHDKILAIFKHQSQKDTAPFPGGHDDREFWERVEARNLETAAMADGLGLPEYYAMEAYRRG